MAGLQPYLRRTFVYVDNRLIRLNRNGVLHQSARGKHVTFVIANVKNVHYDKRSSAGLTAINFKNFYKNQSGLFPGARHCSSAIIINNAKVSDIGGRSPPTGGTASNGLPADATALSSTNGVVIDESLLPPIPTVPTETSVDLMASALEAGLKEPTLASLGLASWWPTGLIQRYLEFLHIEFDLPWWGCIAITTLCLRVLTFPLTIKSRRSAVRMQNNLPKIQYYQSKIEEARLRGNYYDGRFVQRVPTIPNASRVSVQAGHPYIKWSTVSGAVPQLLSVGYMYLTSLAMQELNTFLSEKNMKHSGILLPLLVQTPIFISMYYGLRSMVNTPVESLKEGGMLWFTDLTLADPYYLLPIIITATMSVIVETGAEGGSVQAMKQVWVKYLLRGFPFLLLPITINFPAAVQCYWVATNFFSLGQVVLLKVPPVKEYFKIPSYIKHDPEILNKHKKKGLEEIKQSMKNYKIIRELQDRERLNTVTFEKAGTGPIPRTFKRDPTKT